MYVLRSSNMSKVIEDQPVAINMRNTEETDITGQLEIGQTSKTIKRKISPAELGACLFLGIIFFPPLAVLYFTKSCTDTFLTLGATLLGWWPGMCVAYYKIVAVSEQENNVRLLMILQKLN